jgi:hypothetical protein
MTRFSRLAIAARFWLAALVAVAVAPTAAAARDCEAEQLQCIIDWGSGSYCLHEYITCLRGGIIAY